MPIPVLFDTDAGTDIDDLYALALILAHPQLDLIGVTTIGPAPQPRARLIAKMLRLADRNDVPVLAGFGQRLVDTQTPWPVKLTHTQLVAADDPEHDATYNEAIAFMLDKLTDAREPITIIGTGSWTNIAALLQRVDDRQRANIAALALMGGEVHLNHNESNVANDPEAADVVLQSPVPTFVGTWSVTRQLSFNIDEINEWFADAQSPFLRALHEGTRMWWGHGMRFKPGPVCYDVVPAFWAAGERDAIHCMRLDELRVELAGDHTRGMTPMSWWQRMAAEKSNAMSADHLTVTDTMDATELKRRFVEKIDARLG